MLGHIPLEEERWRRFNDFYINSLRSMDTQIANLLGELDALGLADRTILVFTSDHGEAAGAHGLHGKGPFAYEEGIHIPFIVSHPDVSGGQSCRALSSHIDIVPTLLSMAGVSDSQKGEFAGRELPGKNLLPVIGNAASADVHAAREGVLFTYSGLVANDADLIAVAGQAISAGKSPRESMKASGFKPDLKKRGSLRRYSTAATSSLGISRRSIATNRAVSMISTSRTTLNCSIYRPIEPKRSILQPTGRRTPI